MIPHFRVCFVYDILLQKCKRVKHRTILVSKGIAITNVTIFRTKTPLSGRQIQNILLIINVHKAVRHRSHNNAFCYGYFALHFHQL